MQRFQQLIPDMPVIWLMKEQLEMGGWMGGRWGLTWSTLPSSVLCKRLL